MPLFSETTLRLDPRHRLVHLRGAHRELWHQPALLEEEEEAAEAEEEASQEEEKEEARCLIAMTRTQALVWKSASRLPP